jgi:hypothetical protein
MTGGMSLRGTSNTAIHACCAEEDLINKHGRCYRPRDYKVVSAILAGLVSASAPGSLCDWITSNFRSCND